MLLSNMYCAVCFNKVCQTLSHIPQPPPTPPNVFISSTTFLNYSVKQ